MARRVCQPAVAVLLPLLWSATAEASEQVFDASVKLSSPHCAQFGVSYHSSSSWQADASSALQCQRSCAASDQPCRNFTFHLDSKLCVLLGGEAMVNQDAHAISGPKDCAPLVGSEPMNSTQPLLFVRGALQFNGPGALFEAAVQASLFAAQHTAEEAKDFRAAMVIKKMGPDPYQSFADLDRNSNGVLERDEFVNVSSKLLPLWEVQRAFAQMDRNKDWKLDLGEYTQASHDPGDSAEQVLAEAAGAARRLAQQLDEDERSGLPAAQQEILAAAAAARHAAQMAEVNGEADLRTQALRASEGVQLAVALPPSELAALRCLAVSFAASSAASASAAEEAAHQAAWPAIVATSAWDESQRKDASAYVAGITAGLQAQAHHAQNVTLAIEKAVLKALGGPPEPSTANAVAAETAKTADAVATENRAVIHSIQAPQKTATTGTPPSQMVQQIARAMVTWQHPVRDWEELKATTAAAGWRVENARNFSDPAAANLVWVGDAFSQVFCVDVECVAIGRSHDISARSPCSVALVNGQEEVLLKEIIKPEKPIISCLTPLTGVTKADLDKGISLNEAVAKLKRLLPADAVLVGQSCASDIEWMMLEKGVDFAEVVDLGEIFKGYNARYGNYSVHSLQHEARVLLGKTARGAHDPAWDAQVSVALYKKAKLATAQELTSMQQQLISTKPLPSVAKSHNYNIDGVCMAKFMPKFCTC
ncbi:RNA exonuclease 1 (RNase H(70)) [Durusdinium trenchii]|uniref:RNA exonuclease 1 (RNase H(70)) n=1 Tax=Durusdinium trenchii TaxID=1381693 RepID=A0ABP0MDP6_9DINO